MRDQNSFKLKNDLSQIGKPFGGSQLKGNPKVKRPFSRKHLIHLILKSSKAKGAHSFLHPRNRKKIDPLVRSLAKRFGLSIKDYVNVGNHLHILVKAGHRICLTRFLRTLTGLIPRKLLGCHKTHPLEEPFWDGRPFTKIVSAGKRPFMIIKKYFDKNRKQAQRSVEGFDLRVDYNNST
jgi:REP element-mobilizing transposase RayT